MTSSASAGRPDGDMVKRYLLAQADQATQQWEAAHEERTTSERPNHLQGPACSISRLTASRISA